MRTPFLSLVALLATSLLPAQVCGPVPPPSGQPAIPMTPVCFGLVAPQIVWAIGNPGFLMASWAPSPIPAGLPTFLVFGAPAPPMPIGPPLNPAFGLPGMLVTVPPTMIVVPNGVSGAAPGPPIPLPIPPTGGPLGVVMHVHTLVLMPGPAPTLALTGAVALTI